MVWDASSASVVSGAICQRAPGPVGLYDKGVKSFRAVAQIDIFNALREPSGYNALSYFRT